MNDAQRSACCFRFGAFEFNPQLGELLKHGLKIKLSGQPVEVLAILLERPGQRVTREELQKRLWPNDTVVEFEHSINAGINRLREALGDSANEPRYVETLPRRGYRFIAPVEVISSPQGAAPVIDPVSPEAPAASEPPSIEAPSEEGAEEASADLAGQTVSHYRVLDRIGSGAMGVIYRAEDTRLGRTVALKFLPVEWAQDQQALARFQREARAASALNHPNICTVHDIDDHDGQPFIAMELLEGETLKEMLAVASIPDRRIGGQRPPLQLDTLLDLAIQIASGLEAAHGKGIIHRDIKPANIFLTTLGQAKILDFGVAKLTRGTGIMPVAGSDPEQGDRTTAGPTRTTDDTLTQAGSPIGTAAYMSPEQVRGEVLDTRTDIFSFGAVLYEMTTGRQAFPGGTSTAVQQAILTQAPVSPRSLYPDLPPELEHIINKALEKERKPRYQTAADLKADLELLKRGLELRRVRAALVPAQKGRPQGAPLRGWTAIALIGTVVLVGAALAYWLAQRRPAAPQELKERRLTANPSDNPVHHGVISPDGKYLAYSDQTGLHVKLIQTGETLNVPQPEGPAPEPDGWWPKGWFPDSTKFVATGIEAGVRYSAWVISVLGGPPRKLRDDADVGSVSPDGTLITFIAGSRLNPSFPGIWVMGANGEEPRRLVIGSKDEALGWEVWSPDGKRIAYLQHHRVADKLECSIESRDLEGSQPTVIVSEPRVCYAFFFWFPNGRLVYTRQEPEESVGRVLWSERRNLWEVRVDTRTGVPVSKPRRITNWAETGAMLISGTSDGKRLAVNKSEMRDYVYVGELEGGGRRLKNPRRLTLEECLNEPGAWMPDSKAVLFRSNRNGTWGIYKQGLDETTPQTIVTGPDEMNWPVVSQDGSWILYISGTTDILGLSSLPVRIMRVPASGGPPQLVLEGRGIENLACARSPSTLCVFSELNSDTRQLTLSAFDPLKGREQELARVNLKQRDFYSSWYSWGLSPDGAQLAIAQFDEGEGPIQIIPLAGGKTREVNIKGWHGLTRLSWAADGRGMFVSPTAGQGATVLYVDLEGRAQVIWKQKSGYAGVSDIRVPSPNGRYLALLGYTLDRNVWLLENF